MQKKLEIGGLALALFAAFNLWAGKVFAGYSNDLFVTYYFEFLAYLFGGVGTIVLAAYTLRLIIKSFSGMEELKSTSRY